MLVRHLENGDTVMQALCSRLSELFFEVGHSKKVRGYMVMPVKIASAPRFCNLDAKSENLRMRAGLFDAWWTGRVINPPGLPSCSSLSSLHLWRSPPEKRLFPLLGFTPSLSHFNPNILPRFGLKRWLMESPATREGRLYTAFNEFFLSLAFEPFHRLVVSGRVVGACFQAPQGSGRFLRESERNAFQRLKRIKSR